MVQDYGCEAVAYPEGSFADLSPDPFPADKYWTPEQLTVPLPTEEGAQIIARTWGHNHLAVLTLTSGEWKAELTDGDVASILEWAQLPADLVWHTR